MSLGFSTGSVREGAAVIQVPELRLADGEHLDHAISRAPVFYNPRMRLNRDTAVLALGVHGRHLSRRLVICEPMCGTGVRGIRLALEVPDVEGVIMGDLNPRAVRLAEENAARNDVSDRVRVRLMEANLLLSLHDHSRRRFDYIDLDPYGSPAPYLDAAVRSCRNRGMVALTATDMAPLCGVNPRACLRKYGGLPLRTPYSHEVALRLLAGALVVAAARHGEARCRRPPRLRIFRGPLREALRGARTGSEEGGPLPGRHGLPAPLPCMPQQEGPCLQGVQGTGGVQHLRLSDGGRRPHVDGRSRGCVVLRRDAGDRR